MFKFIKRMRGIEGQVNIYIITLLVILGLLAGAYYFFTQITPAQSPPEITQEKTFEANFDTVWAAIVNALTEEDEPIQSIEKQSGLITTQFVSLPVLHLERYLDEIAVRPRIFLGMGYWSAARYRLSIFVKDINGKTRVLIKPFIEAYESTETKKWHVCNSTGTIEKRFFDSIEHKLSKD